MVHNYLLQQNQDYVYIRFMEKQAEDYRNQIFNLNNQISEIIKIRRKDMNKQMLLAQQNIVTPKSSTTPPAISFTQEKLSSPRRGSFLNELRCLEEPNQGF